MERLIVQERLRGFFSPQNIAVVGASTKNNWFANIIKCAEDVGFTGCFFPVNPGGHEIYGIKSFPSIAQLPEDVIDFAAVIVKGAASLAVLNKLAGKGIKNVLLISSGFAETGDHGAHLQAVLTALCRDKGIMLLGPNCLGFMNIGDKVSVFAGRAVQGELIGGNIGVLGQSGATSEVIVTKIMKKGLGVSLYVTTGNEAVLTSEGCMEYMLESGTTRVIVGFIEGFRDLAGMRRIALTAAQRKIPIILIKVGRSEKGQRAARSHTGALAGNATVLDGFFRQYGIIRVDTIEEMVETAGIFSRCPLPSGGRVGISTISGGLGGLYADLCDRLSIELPDLSPATVHSLSKLLPDFARPANPLDVTGSGFSSGMDRIVRTLLDDENIDILLPTSLSPESEADEFIHAYNASFLPLVHVEGKLIIPIAFREVNDYARKFYRDHGVYFIEQAENGFRAVSHLIRYAQFQKRFSVAQEKI